MDATEIETAVKDIQVAVADFEVRLTEAQTKDKSETRRAVIASVSSVLTAFLTSLATVAAAALTALLGYAAVAARTTADKKEVAKIEATSEWRQLAAKIDGEFLRRNAETFAEAASSRRHFVLAQAAEFAASVQRGRPCEVCLTLVLDLSDDATLTRWAREMDVGLRKGAWLGPVPGPTRPGAVGGGPALAAADPVQPGRDSTPAPAVAKDPQGGAESIAGLSTYDCRVVCELEKRETAIPVIAYTVEGALVNCKRQAVDFSRAADAAECSDFHVSLSKNGHILHRITGSNRDHGSMMGSDTEPMWRQRSLGKAQ